MVHGTPYAVTALSATVTRTNIGRQYSSTEDDPNEAEWISEGVQVGAVGSGTGIVGMWTGVKHLIDDPIGEQPSRDTFHLQISLICYPGAWWQWRAA